MATRSSAFAPVSETRGSKTTTLAPFFLPCVNRTARLVDTPAIEELLAT